MNETCFIYVKTWWNSNRSCWTGKLSEFCGSEDVMHKNMSYCKYLWRCIACSSPTLCLQISLSSWMKVLYFLNTSCNIPILKPNTSASVFTFLITLSWLLKKDRDRFFSWFTHCRLLAQMHFSWFSGNTTVGLECIYISVCFQRHSRGCFPTLRFVFSCIKIIMSNPLLWVASLIT